MPGDMGHGIAKVLVENNFKVLTFLKGRSKRTLQLASKANVRDVDNFKTFLKSIILIFLFQLLYLDIYKFFLK